MRHHFKTDTSMFYRVFEVLPNDPQYTPGFYWECLQLVVPLTDPMGAFKTYKEAQDNAEQFFMEELS